jgi:hypothetical protein
MNDIEVIGAGVTGFGVAFFILGIFTFLNRKLLVTSTILVVLGLGMGVGPISLAKLLIRKDRLKGTIAYFAGVVLVFLKLSLPGVACEVVGAYWLFGGFLPIVLSIVSRIPIVGHFIPSSMKKEDLDV